jgi:hypothetical protein
MHAEGIFTVAIPASESVHKLQPRQEYIAMKMHKLLIALLGSFCGLAASVAMAQDASCSHVNGSWVDNYGDYWSLNNGTGTVIGGCIDDWGSPVVWDATASMSGGGSFVLTATNQGWYGQYGYEDCTQSFTFHGGEYPGGCRSADGTWTNPQNPTAGVFSMTKTCDVPTSETTHASAEDWTSAPPPHAIDGAGPYFAYRANVADGSTGNIRGRRMREGDYNTAYDSCYYSSSQIPQWTGVTNPPPWPIVDTSNKYTDTLGWGSDAITWYRAHQSLPCSVHLYQKMELSCGTFGTDSGWSDYHHNVMIAEITDATHITETRDGVSHPRTYP